MVVAAEHKVAKKSHDAGLAGRNEVIGDGDGEFGEEATDFVGRDHGTARSDEFAGEIGWAKAAARGVSMRVAESVGLGSSGEGASASVGKLKLAAVVGGFGAFRSHAG